MKHLQSPSCSLALLPAVLAMSLCGPARSLEYATLGPSDETYVVSAGGDNCTGTLMVNHGGSFENGYCWQFSGCVPPYGGSFGEGFQGPAFLECAAFWATQIGSYSGQPFDLYVWEGGVSGAPGAVLFTATGATLSNVPMWPVVGQSDVSLGYYVSAAEFTLGFWADNRTAQCPWFVASDTNGPAGHPWTHIAPGTGFPSGWQSPAVVAGWGPVTSLGIGYYAVETGVGPSPAPGQALRVLPARGDGRCADIVYGTSQDGWVRIEVLEGNGRCVATIVDAYQPAGEHRAQWQGRARDGRPLPGGIYVLMMRSSAGCETAKAMVLR